MTLQVIYVRHSPNLIKPHLTVGAPGDELRTLPEVLSSRVRGTLLVCERPHGSSFTALAAFGALSQTRLAQIEGMNVLLEALRTRVSRLIFLLLSRVDHWRDTGCVAPSHDNSAP